MSGADNSYDNQKILIIGALIGCDLHRCKIYRRRCVCGLDRHNVGEADKPVYDPCAHRFIESGSTLVRQGFKVTANLEATQS